MSDYASSLPVRTENDGDIKSILVDSLVPAQQLEITSDRRAKVDQVKLDSATDSVTVEATDLDIRDLNSATDSVTVVATDLDIRNLDSATDSVAVIATDLDIRDLNSATDSVTVIATDLDIRDLDSATDSVTVVATDLDIRPLTSTEDDVKARLADAAGNYYSVLNPLTVSLSANNQGEELNDFDVEVNAALNTSVNHDYTVPAGKVLFVTQFSGAASGRAKFELQVETGVATGVFTTKFVEFNSTANPNVGKELKAVLTVAAGVIVRMVKTNRDLVVQDLYSTISGQLVDL